MTEKEKPETRQETGGKVGDSRRRKDTSKIDFLLSDAGFNSPFDQLVKIAETRQNSFVKNRIIQLSNLIKKSVAELIENNSLLYSEIDSLKKSNSEIQEFILFCAEKNGFDPNLYSMMFEVEKSTIRAMKQVDKTFEEGQKWIKAHFPQHYQKYFANAESN